jgi:hypothetical protein
MGESIDPMKLPKSGAALKPLRDPIVSMSSRLVIPRRVALQQSPLPLRQPGTSMQQVTFACKKLAANGNLSLINLSHRDRALQDCPPFSSATRICSHTLVRIPGRAAPRSHAGSCPATVAGSRCPATIAHSRDGTKRSGRDPSAGLVPVPCVRHAHGRRRADIRSDASLRRPPPGWA